MQGGDFAALLDVDLGPHPLAAVRDNIQWRTPGRRPEQFRRLGLPAAPVLQRGVLLIDVGRLQRAATCSRAASPSARSHPPSAMIRHDQDLLNAMLHGDWAELSPVWNWQYTWASRLFEAMADAHVVHFIGPKKPWTHDRRRAAAALPPRLPRVLRGALPRGAAIGEDGVAPMANRAFLQRSLAKHLVSAHKMSAYLDAVPDRPHRPSLISTSAGPAG